ncbi:MAG: hypothetical protein N2747_01070 [Chitinophagaceae bacterium]|nr:hypothetical protein [Chitinophagaceae bacterium]
MNDNLKDILSHLSPHIDQELLLRYLQGKLSESQKHEVEKQLLRDPFADEALEGLQQFRDKETIELLVEKLNRELKKKTEKRRRKFLKKPIHLPPWIYLAVIMILLLAVLSYLLIRYTQQ